MDRWSRITGIQSTIGIVSLIIFVVLAALVVSWGATCLVVYWISLLWAGTVFAFEWSWTFATGVWLVLCLIGSFCQARINLDD